MLHYYSHHHTIYPWPIEVSHNLKINKILNLQLNFSNKSIRHPIRHRKLTKKFKNCQFWGLCAKSVGQIWKNYLTRIYQGPKLYSLMQKNGYIFALVYSSNCVSVFLHQTLLRVEFSTWHLIQSWMDSSVYFMYKTKYMKIYKYSTYQIVCLGEARHPQRISKDQKSRKPSCKA